MTKDFLVVINGLKKFAYFLLPKKFVLRTDNIQVKAFIKNNLPSKPKYKSLIDDKHTDLNIFLILKLFAHIKMLLQIF